MLHRGNCHVIRDVIPLIKNKMDPWSNCQLNVTSLESKTRGTTKFEDNFTDRLPDSQEYLAILEEKLRRLRDQKNTLQQLAEKKEACMQQLLAENSSENYDLLSLDEPVSNSQIIRHLLPEKQALSQGEIVDLIKYDQLISGEDELEIENKPPEN